MATAKDFHIYLNFLRGLSKIMEEDWQRFAQDLGLTQAEQHALWVIDSGEKATMSQVAKVGLWDLSTVMQLIKRLKQKGLVTTTKDEQDLRISYVTLTEEGKRRKEQSATYSHRLQQVLSDYENKSNEHAQFMDELKCFLEEINQDVHGKEFVNWVYGYPVPAGENVKE
ncbi:MarR family winged helix-turn-helix transcriptional regulator [Salsuginibacillus kocurii]|uniref:MarR family winged helix-turn-helix transcriptional regulator n=1 Tax=Salsuginibacillus kocurii TaxID=427078 RepID=UPI00037C2E62|nr:MarR family transcriptional regulator [Salsuginibacillus kocurii]